MSAYVSNDRCADGSYNDTTWGPIACTAYGARRACRCRGSACKCLANDVAGGIRSARVIEELMQLASVHGAPRHIRSDNGPEFSCGAILRWLPTAQSETVFIYPGKPWQKGADESFDGKFRDQHLSLQWFRNRLEAKGSIEHWRQQGPARFESRVLDAGRIQSETSSRLERGALAGVAGSRSLKHVATGLPDAATSSRAVDSWTKPVRGSFSLVFVLPVAPM